MMNKTQIFWDKQANRFADNEKQFEPASQELIARTKEYLNSNDNVLDFGCATGTKTLELNKKGLVTVSGKLSDDVRPGTLQSVLRQAGLK